MTLVFRSLPDTESKRARERATRDAAAQLVVSIAEELARPLAEIRELLAAVVDTFDTHVATSKGPVALSYDDTKRIREEIADAYLKSGDAARLARELASAVKPGGAVESGMLDQLVEAALILVRARFAASTELFIDLGDTPPVSVVASETVLAIARVLVFCAESTASAEDAAVSIRTRCARERDEVILRISENGRGGSDVEIARACDLLEKVAARAGGQLFKTSELGSGSTFELRLPVSG